MSVKWCLGYRCGIVLASGLYAMLDDGMGFSLMLWKSGVEKQLGQIMIAVTRGNSVSWDSNGHSA
nr:DUF3363 domain-containing protein [uncultured Rhodoferax sp.]